MSWFYCINRGHNILTSDIENYIFDVSDKNVQKAEDALNDNDAKAITLAKRAFQPKLVLMPKIEASAYRQI